jgi:erythrocyte band 7 integral membrane protein
MAGMAQWYVLKSILATSTCLTKLQINTLGSCIGTLGAIPCCIVCPNPYKPVSQGNVGLVTKFGRFARAVDPGLVYVNPLSEQLVQVDIKIQIVEVPKQVCMTKDNVSLNLTSVIYYRITSPHKAAFSISNIRQALVERTQTTLRHVVGARVLQDVIERREEIAQSIREIIEETALGWGVEVESMLVKDIIFSQELQDSLSMAAQSKRTGEAKVIAARAEVESAKRKSYPPQNLPAPSPTTITTITTPIAHNRC